MVVLELLLIAGAVLFFWGWVSLAVARCFVGDRAPNPWALACGGLSLVALLGLSLMAGGHIDPLGLLFALLVTPVVAFLTVTSIPVKGFVLWILPFSGVAAATVFVVLRRCGPLQMAAAAALFAAGLVASVLAEPLSQRAMCRAADGRSATEMHRASIWSSLGALSGKIRAAHAWLRSEGQILIWSYREMRFVPLSETRWQGVLPAFEC